jgi:hypothetical protein
MAMQAGIAEEEAPTVEAESGGGGGGGGGGGECSGQRKPSGQQCD